MSGIKLTDYAHGGGCGCKISPQLLGEILRNTPRAGPFAALLVGTETSDDAAVYKLNDEQALIATTDFFMPIVDDPYDFGRIAATNAISDVYAMGGTPILALALLGMPIDKLSPQVIGRILDGGADVCAAAGIPVAGGHSIDTPEPIYGLVALGLVHPDHIKRNCGARARDVLILGKGLGVGVHALTDVTGFGLLGHLLEICRGSGLAARIEMARVPLLAGAEDFARQGIGPGAIGRNWASYGADVGLREGVAAWQRELLCDAQTSGGLLVACDAGVKQEVLGIFRAQGFAQAAEIGVLSAGAPRVEVC